MTAYADKNVRFRPIADIRRISVLDPMRTVAGGKTQTFTRLKMQYATAINWLRALPEIPVQVL